jgi:glycosyltransferase involved in cell wall biosynthesis
MKQPISVVVMCSDDLQRLETCINRCVNFADEILIAECLESVDAQPIANDDERIRVVPYEPIRKDDFLNWSISKASHEWVMLLDSDERMNQALADEIELVLSRGATHDAYTIDRDTFVNGKSLEAQTSTLSRRVRLFRRDQVFCTQSGSVKKIEIQSARIGKLSNKISHHPDWRFERSLDRLSSYAALDAETWNEQATRFSAFKMLLAPAYHFALQYFWRGSIFDGAAGIRCSWQAAFQQFCTHAFLRDLQQSSNAGAEAETVDPGTIDLLDPTFRRAA